MPQLGVGDICDRCRIGIMRRMNSRRLELIGGSNTEDIAPNWSVQSIECDRCAHMHHRVLIVQNPKSRCPVIEADFIE